MPGDPFYQSAAWRAFRRKFLRDNPRCTVPGCPLKASRVDHKVTRRNGGADLDPSNCAPYCESHHNAKTALRDRPSYRSSDAALTVKGCDSAGWPIDPRHNR